MKHLVVCVAMVAMLTLGMFTAAAAPQTCTLELKRAEPPGTSRISSSSSSLNYLLQTARYQTFYMRTGSSPMNTTAAAFSRVIEKEPAEYNAEHPFRAVATLGGQQYGFVLDSAPSQSDAPPAGSATTTAKPLPATAKAAGYSRLYFDLNHNGDLTDDQVIEAKRPASRAPVSTLSTYSRFEFPRVDLTIEVDGKKLEYAFSMRGYFRVSTSYNYARAYLTAAAYRQGQIELDGKTRRIFLLDFNGNGRFDDRTTVTRSGTRVYQSPGDMLLVDPESKRQSPMPGFYDRPGQALSKLANIDGRYYEVKVSAAGDELTLTPSSAALGYLKSPVDGLQAVFHGEQGVLKIKGGRSESIPLPEGEWNLASYTIFHNAQQKPPSKTGPLPSVMPGGFSMVSAGASSDSPSIRVRADETLELPFGPPYKPVVKGPNSLRAGQTASLALSLVGRGGEVCTGLYVNGRRPDSPEFTIKTSDGEEVDVGKFKYG